MHAYGDTCHISGVEHQQVLAAVKFASLLPSLAYLWFPEHLLSDAAAVAYVAAHWLLGGLIGAWTFVLLPHALPGPTAATLGGAAIALAFQAACACGLAAAFLLELLFRPPS